MLQAPVPIPAALTPRFFSNLSTTTSPGGKTTATLYLRDCGATTAVVRIVALRASSEAFDPEKLEDVVLTYESGDDVTFE